MRESAKASSLACISYIDPDMSQGPKSYNNHSSPRLTQPTTGQNWQWRHLLFVFPLPKAYILLLYVASRPAKHSAIMATCDVSCLWLSALAGCGNSSPGSRLVRQTPRARRKPPQPHKTPTPGTRQKYGPTLPSRERISPHLPTAATSS